MDHVSNQSRPGLLAGTHASAEAGATTTVGGSTRVLRDTYSLLSMTLLFSAACAAAHAAASSWAGSAHTRQRADRSRDARLPTANANR